MMLKLRMCVTSIVLSWNAVCETQGEIFLPVRSHPNHHFPRNDSCVRNEEKAKFAATYAIHYQFLFS